MTGDVGARSFDHPRERPAPGSWTAVNLDGESVEVEFDRVTLVVAVKASCDGCREFLFAGLEELSGVSVLVVSHSDEGAQEWAGAARAVLVAPDLLDALDVRSAPFYVLVRPPGPMVVAEGSVFSAAQVAAEIARRLA